MASGESSNVSEVQKTEEKEEYNPKLDFFSEHFDPLLALQTPDLVVPVSNAKVYDNIGKYKSNVDGVACENRSKKTEKSDEQKPSFERRWLPHQLPIRTEKKMFKNIFSKMEQMVGPLQLLKSCVDKHQKIKVWTRHSHDIRGYCIGYVIAFDRHWNLALEQVEEVWTRAKRRKIPALEGIKSEAKFRPKVLPSPVTILKSTKKTETCSRHVKQLLLRGEHIAFVVVLPTEMNLIK